jgi:hypothetical protein
MTAIFISHRSSDDAEADALRGWLGAQGHEQLFLDFDPADGIPAGVDWEQRLYQELRRCQALLIVLTPAWLESKWCGNELAIAREKGKAVFVVRVKPCAGGPVIPAIQEVDLTVDREAGLTKLARGLKEHGLDPASAFDWKPGRPIYPGLAAFDVDDAAIFFGRSEESWQVVEALRRLRLQATGSPKLLLITGASGSGKSSLMRAGVLARLRKESASWIVAKPFRRSGGASGALAEVLAWAFPAGRRPPSLAAMTEKLSGQDGAAQLLGIARELRLALDRPDGTLVLALDQAEELLTAEAGDDAAELLDLIRSALAVVGNEILVIATIRSDRLGAWQQHPSIKATAEHGELPFEMLPLGSMPMAQIGDIVRGPASYEGLRIDDDLVDAIRADTATPDALPLLAYTLQYMHDHFAGDGRLTLAEYRSFGGLEGSVRSQADAAIPVDRLSEEDRRALREAFVPGLVRATSEGGFSRSRARLATLSPRAEPYLRRLIDDARLLTTDRDPEGGVTVEVAHESLLRVWPTLERWIADDAQSLRRLEALQRAARDWAQALRSDDFLLHRDHRLSDAELLIAEPRFAAQLGDTDRDYLAACGNAQNRREAEEKESRERELRAARELAQEQKAKTQRTLIGLAAACALALVAAGLGWWAWEKAGEAEQQRNAAESAKSDAVAQRDTARQEKAEAERQLTRANAALAAGLWNDLDFASEDSLAPAERNALWTLAEDGGPVRAPFVKQLSADTERMQRFARRPEPVARALGLGWPVPQEAQPALRQALAMIGDTTGHDQLAGLANAAAALAANLTSEQAYEALTPTLAALAGARDPWQLLTLAQVVKAFPVQVTADQSNSAMTSIVAAIDRTMRPSRVPVQSGALEVLAQAMQVLAGRLTDGQAHEALLRLLGVPENPDNPDQLLAVVEAMQELPVSLSAAQAQEAMANMLAAITRKTDLARPQVLALAAAGQALAAKLTADQAADATTPMLEAVEGTADYGQARALTSMLRALAGQLTEKAKLDALGRILDRLKDTTAADRFFVLTWAAKALSQTIPWTQARDVAAPALTALASADDPWKLQALADALAVPLSAEQTQNALAEMARTTSSDQLRVLLAAAPKLTSHLTPEQASAAARSLGDVMRGADIRRTTDPAPLWVLAQAMHVLAARLTPEQGGEALGELVGVLVQLHDFQSDSSLALALTQAMRALPAQLTGEQAHEALRSLLDTIRYATNPDELPTLGFAAQNLVAKLTTEQIQAGLSSLIAAMDDAPSSDVLETLVQAMQPMSNQLRAWDLLATRLAWAPTRAEATAWAGALVHLLPRSPPQVYIEQIVEALKYPTSAGPATAVLLDALREAEPSAPGKEAGLGATLSWLRVAHPAIDLEGRPRCPKSPAAQKDLVCPPGTA